MTEVTAVTLSEKGLCMILLEQELRNAQLYERRCSARLSETRSNLNEATAHMIAVEKRIQAIKESI